MDNTSSDNKTKVHFMVQKFLVQSGMFKTVTTGFLPVGHTHEDIDPAFSVIAQYLHGHTCDTFQQLANACSAAFVDETYAEVLLPEKLCDYGSWLGRPFLSEEFEGISGIHIINFSSMVVDSKGAPVPRYKQWMRQSRWIFYMAPLRFQPRQYFVQPILPMWDLAHLSTVRDKYTKSIEAQDAFDRSQCDLIPAGEQPHGLTFRRQQNGGGRGKRSECIRFLNVIITSATDAEAKRCARCAVLMQGRRDCPRSGAVEVVRKGKATSRRLGEELYAHKMGGSCTDDHKRQLAAANFVEMQLLACALTQVREDYNVEMMPVVVYV